MTHYAQKLLPHSILHKWTYLTCALLTGLALVGSVHFIQQHKTSTLAAQNAVALSEQPDATFIAASNNTTVSAAAFENIKAAHEAEKFAVKPDTKAGNWIAANNKQNWNTNFDTRGFLVTPKSAAPSKNDWQWGLELKSYGFAGQEKIVSEEAAVKTANNHVSHSWNDGLEEWYSNDARGLEHGFTLPARPAKSDVNSPLAFNLNVRGSLTAKADADGQGIKFVNASGISVLTYNELKVTDADGKLIAANLKANGKDIQFLINESDARYPLTIDPLAAGATEVYIKADKHTVTDVFGHAVAIDGATMVVGAPLEDTTGADAGAAYVYVSSGGVWMLQQVLRAPADALLNIADRFGSSVDISGDVIVVGAPLEDSSTTGVNSTPNNLGVDQGAAYVYVRTGTTWTLQAYLKASNTTLIGTNHFGQGVAVSGNTVVVTAPFEDNSQTGAGNNGLTNDFLGVDSGAGYVFTRTGTTWTQQQYLKASNAQYGDYFGGNPLILAGEIDWTGSVDISGDTIVIGAPLEDSGSTGVNGDQGNALTGVIDALPNNPLLTLPTGLDSGAAYVFKRGGTVWTQEAYLKASNTGFLDYFGSSVSISGDNIVVGAPFEDGMGAGVDPPAVNNLNIDSGAAYTFTRGGTTWTPAHYLKQTNNTTPQIASYFGWSVGIDGTKVIVGAPFEDSNGMGLNGVSNNILSANSGAAYTFTGVGAAAENYYKACNNNIADVFGAAVAISADCPVVGAPLEDGSGVLINPADNNANVNAGAVYIPGNCNTPPTVTATPVTVVQGTSLTATPIGTASDLEDPKNIISVEISNDGGLTWGTAKTLNGVTVTLVDQNGAAAGVNPTAAGVIIADVGTTCASTTASFLLRSIDSAGLISLIPAPLVVTVIPNTAPVLTYANVGANLGGVSTVNTPLTASDATPNPAGTVYSLMSVGTYTGISSINSSTGVVTFTGQAPVGTHTIMVKAFDGCLTTTATFTITVKKMEVTISDPIACTGPNNTVSVHAEFLNGNATASAFNFVATPTAPLAGVPGTCVSNFGTCVITAASVTVTGTLPAGATLIVDYKAIVPSGTAPGTQLCINSVGKLDVNNNGGFDVIETVMACTTLTCPPKVVNPKMSDQKAGSLLAFPYYTSKSGENKDTQITISNTGDAQANVHMFFIDGATCNQADQFACLTPNASLTFKVSEYDPETTGWLLAVAVDANGKPTQNNGLIGSAFVNDGNYVDSYGAESFWANSPIVSTLSADGMSATLYFDGSSYDAMPNSFVAEIQSPLSTIGQRIVTVGMTGNLSISGNATGGLTGAGQVGVGIAYNADERAASFSGLLSGTCQASKVLTNSVPRVPGSLGGLIPKGQSGSIKFTTGGGVGLIMTPKTEKWSGIRGLHKLGNIPTTMTVPVLTPVCR